jgi:UDP-hydrolysing UDP-N-acetyl-D-glucosamine 2-epimerase
MRKIGLVTVSRSDWGIYLPLLRRIIQEPGLELLLIVAGMHLSPEFGLTAEKIRADGFDISEKVEMLVSSDTPEGIAKSMGLGTIGFAQAYGRLQPDILVLLGDRFEMHAAAVAAVPFKIPIAHIHGGEITEGAIDNALRHSITKLSHLHFVSLPEYGRRISQMGEEPWRVMVTGAPGLDNLFHADLMTRQELEDEFHLSLRPPFLFVTYHPVTLEYEQTEWQIGEMLAALEDSNLPAIFSMPNADTSGRVIARMLRQYVMHHPLSQWVDNLGTKAYWGVLRLATALVGNSSSGIIEAPSFCLPVVNIGTRQKGRVRAGNVIDVGYGRMEILEGIKKATAPGFREALRGLENPYGRGDASIRIVSRLKEVPLGSKLVAKPFYDFAVSPSSHSWEESFG